MPDKTACVNSRFTKGGGQPNIGISKGKEREKLFPYSSSVWNNTFHEQLLILSFRRDIIPMCKVNISFPGSPVSRYIYSVDLAQEEGMGLAPWGALGGGNFKSDEQRQSQEGRKMGEASPAAIKISKVLERIANSHNAEITSVALAYVMQKTPYVFPIVGGRKLEHLKGNIAGLSIDLSEKDMDDIEEANPFDIGFPMNFLGGPGKLCSLLPL
jgi:predicted oxidoreductase